MRERRLNSGPDSREHVGVLPTGELYVDREIASDDMPDCVLSDFVAPGDVARLKSLLAMGGAMTDEELLDRLAGRFRRGADLVKWLRASGISTAPRSVGGICEPLRSSSPARATQEAMSREFAPGTRFYEVEGVPVALEPAKSGAPVVTAVDPVRRDFPLDAVYRSGIEITPGRFDELAGTFAAASDREGPTARVPASGCCRAPSCSRSRVSRSRSSPRAKAARLPGPSIRRRAIFQSTRSRATALKSRARPSTNWSPSGARRTLKQWCRRPGPRTIETPR